MLLKILLQNNTPAETLTTVERERERERERVKHYTLL